VITVHGKLALKKEDLLNILNHLDVAVWIIDLSTQDAFFSNGFEKIFGRKAEEFYQDSNLWLKTIHPEDVTIAKNRKIKKKQKDKAIDEYRIIKPNGEVRWVQDRGLPFQDVKGDKNIYIGIIIDITDRKKIEAKMIHSANHDDLTGLPNRKYLNEQLMRAVENSKRDSSSLAIMFIDLDHFKMINDTLGHSIGDLLLKQVGNRISSCLIEGGLVSRQAGDEFIIFIKGVTRREIDEVSEKIHRSLDFPFILGGNEVYITTSIGISVYPEHGTDPDSLIKNADAAMYEVKYNGKNHSRYYSYKMEETLNRRMIIVNGLRKALENEDLELYFQPKIDLASNTIIGVEVLLRWKHPQYGMIPPSEFIPIAEETGLIIPIGEWVIRTAFKQYKKWEVQGIAPPHLCINVSPGQFLDPFLVKKIDKAIKDFDFNPRCLDLEITESVAMYNLEEAVNKLYLLKDLGIMLALDDFGTGYSSLNYLQRFPIDKLKIDCSFIMDVNINSQTASIVKSIIFFAHSLNLKVVAEGVETEEQVDLIKSYQCDMGQGYFFSRPLPGEDIEPILIKGIGSA
jgi:diguanylate cyclase (GGDEF)-like protein/PAS domain S-box-containing protein